MRASSILLALLLAIPIVARADPIVRVVADRIVLSSPLRYDTHGSALDPADAPLLDAVAAFLQSRGTMTLEIGAHTDSRGSEEYNLRITQSVADQVRSGLLVRGIAASRLTAIGYGEARPIADNLTLTGRAQNHRIELIVTHP